MKICLIAPALSLLAAPSAARAACQDVPETVQQSLAAAEASGDAYLIEAVQEKAGRDYPALAACLTEPTPAAEEIAAAPTPEEPAEPVEKSEAWWSEWKGEVEAGARVASGNSHEKDFATGLTLTYDPSESPWDHTFKAKAVSREVENETTKEKYSANLQDNYNWTERSYLFGESEFVKDRFSGVEHRLSQFLGYGRKLITRDDLRWNAEIGAGIRQTKQTDGHKDTGAAGKIETDFEWDINDRLSFSQLLGASLDSTGWVGNSETALKSSITETLSLKLGFDVDYVSDTPVGKKSTDTVSTLGVIASF